MGNINELEEKITIKHLKMLMERGMSWEEIREYLFPPEEKTFKVMVLYDRGLGDESVTLEPVAGKTLKEAYTKAEQSAEEFFKSKPRLKIKEIKLMP